MDPSVFSAPERIVVGGGARRSAGAEVVRLGGKRALLVTDKMVGKLHLADDVIQSLEAVGIATAIFDGVLPDPTDANVADGLAAARAHNADVVVTVGGGSAMDTAKVVAALTANSEPLQHYAGRDRFTRAGLPVIAVPTTAGTGSEVTPVAVITQPEHGIKLLMISRFLLPRVALVDHELSRSMPPNLTAAVGVDTLTHGIESFVSKRANGLADAMARSCILLVSRHLVDAYSTPDNGPAREGMMLAACQGGLAFANSSVALVHGMSRPIGALFHLPHGLSNAVLLPTVTRFSYPSAPAKYAEVARTVGCAPSVAADDAACTALVTWLENLNRALGIDRLGSYLRSHEDRFRASLPKMAEDALASGSPGNNPRVPSTQEVVALYQEAW